MYQKIIRLMPMDSISYNEAKDEIWGFLFALECNGQILKSYSVIKSEDYLLYVTSPKSDSLDEKYDSEYVTKRKDWISEHYSIKIEDIGINLESQEYCQCKERSAIEMQTHRFDIDSVFTCCDCGKPIALYELPKIDGEKDFCDIQLWQDNYASVDMLWLNCLCDRYSGNQRVKPDSALNRQGYKIARSMRKAIGIPVYYHLECDYGKSVRAEQVGTEQIHLCPGCERRMKRINISEEIKIDTCSDCGLSYDAH